jgi:hypothetical protein
METAKLLISVVAVILSVASLALARLADVRSRKAEAIRNLLGEKETVAFGALKLLRDGLPSTPRDRRLVVAALMQATVFEGSDRARALLYRVIETNRGQFQKELDEALVALEATLTSMRQYAFTQEELDLSRGERRVAAVRKILRATAA